MLLGNLRNDVLSELRKKVLKDKLMWISHTTTTLVRNNMSRPISGVSLGTESAAPKVDRRIKAWENKNSAFNWPGKSDPYLNIIA